MRNTDSIDTITKQDVIGTEQNVQTQHEVNLCVAYVANPTLWKMPRPSQITALEELFKFAGHHNKQYRSNNLWHRTELSSNEEIEDVAGYGTHCVTKSPTNINS